LLLSIKNGGRGCRARQLFVCRQIEKYLLLIVVCGNLATEYALNVPLRNSLRKLSLKHSLLLIALYATPTGAYIIFIFDMQTWEKRLANFFYCLFSSIFRQLLFVFWHVDFCQRLSAFSHHVCLHRSCSMQCIFFVLMQLSLKM